VLLFGSSADLSTSFTCYAKDDGSFTFPSSTKTVMTEQKFIGRLDGAARLSYRSERKGDNLLLLMMGSLEFYALPVLPEIPSDLPAIPIP
jgi:hypothetical protein